MNVMTLDTVFAQLRERGLLAGEVAPLPAQPPATPWFVRTLAGFGAWLGGMFLLGWLMALFGAMMDSATGMLVLGIFTLAGAFGIYRAARQSEALQQIGLAFSMAGQFSFAFGLEGLFRWGQGPMAGLVCLMQLALVMLINNPLHRYLCALFAAMAGYWFLLRVQALPLGGALLAAAVTWIWLNESRWTAARRAEFFRPVGYAFALALLLWQAPLSLREFAGWWWRDGFVMVVPYWVTPLAFAASVAVSAGVLARRQSAQAWQRWMAAALVVSVVAWLAPGLLAALLVLLLGAGTGNRILGGLALLAGAWYLGAYYYQLQVTLLEKSGVMLATGLVLLALRFVMSRFWPAEGKQ